MNTGLDILALRNMVMEPLDLDSNDPNEIALTDIMLNRAFWEILDKFKFRKEEIMVTRQTIIGERNYNVPEPLEAIVGVYIEDLDSQEHTPLGQITAETYESRWVNNQDNWDKPTHYVREFCLIRLWRTPDKVYPMVLRRRIVLGDIALASNSYPDIPKSWHEIIGYGGLWRMYLHKNMFNMAREIKAHQVSLLNSILEMHDKEEQANVAKSGRLEVAWDEFGEFTGSHGQGGRLDW